MTLDTTKYKKLLEEELAELEEELSEIGFRPAENPDDWEAKAADLNVSSSDENEVADTIEEYEENSAILKELEIRYNEIKKALERIKDGTYGICEVGGEPISEKRLKANPAARFCLEHAPEEDR